MTEDDKTGISHLIEKELNSADKILKPDFNQKTGRELLAFYLQSKFKQVLAYDNKAAEPIFVEVRYDFIQKFSRRLIQKKNNDRYYRRVCFGKINDMQGNSKCYKTF